MPSSIFKSGKLVVDANHIRRITVAEDAPADGEGLLYDADTGKLDYYPIGKTIAADLEAVRNKYVRASWFAEATGVDSGTITLPVTGVMQTDLFAGGADILVSELGGDGRPNYQPVYDAGGTLVTGALSGSGNLDFTLSASSYSGTVALVYVYDVMYKNYDSSYNLAPFNLIWLEPGDLTGTPDEIDLTTDGKSITFSLPVAVTGKLVTNGNSHDHVGGDGAQIDHNQASNLTTGDVHTQYALLAGRDGDILAIDQVKAYDGAGLKLYDDGGKGIFIKDGGEAGFYGINSPETPIHLLVNVSAKGITIDRAVKLATYQSFIFAARFQNSADEWLEYIQLRAGIEDPTDGAEYGFFTIVTITNGSTTEKLRVTGTGDVLVGTTTKPTANGGKVLTLGDNAADPTMASNTAGIYAKDVSGTVEMFAIDEANNATQISSHNFDLFEPPEDIDYPWSFYARNEELGVEVSVDMASLVRDIEKLTGKKYLYKQEFTPSTSSLYNRKKDGFRKNYKENHPNALDAEVEAAVEAYKPVIPAWYQRRLDKVKAK
jgi:hypothetical protein